MKSVPTAFAVLDILGYGELMRRDPDEVLTIVQELLRASERNWIVQRDLDQFAHFSGTAHAPVIKYLQFSDTLLIWLPSDPLVPTLPQTPAQLVRSICYAASLTLASFIAAGLPLRGAIGFGPTFVSRDPLFFTGGELYESAKLERKQAWAGAALHDSAAKALTVLPDEPFIVEYSVPMSEAASPKPTLAVDWVSCCLSSSATIVPPWDLMFSSKDAKVQKKREETRRFFETLEPQHRPFPVRLAQETIADIRERLTGILSVH